MENTSSSSSPFIPVLLVAVAVLLLLVWQFLIAWNTRGNLRAQFENRKQLVTQSELVQGNVQKLINDLLELAVTDADAKKVVDKYNIRRNEPTATITE